MGRQIWMKKWIFGNWGHIKEIFSLPPPPPTLPKWAWERRRDVENIEEK